MTKRIYTVLGLMSGTSLDGIDLAILKTDGDSRVEFGPWDSVPYASGLRGRLRAILGMRMRDGTVAAVERELTERHAAAIAEFCRTHAIAANGIDLIGFHGQTIWHNPAGRETLQIGDGALLADLTGIPVINDFRAADVAAGGQGAPFAPLYHRALANSGKIEKPLAILNIGGVANVTWLGQGEAIRAFDTGPGNAMIDDWLLAHTGMNYDKDGALAARGTVDQAVVKEFLALPFFALKPPKSLDRDAFKRDWCKHLSTEDGAATLTELTVASISASLAHMQQAPKRWLVTGGGRHNKTLLGRLAERLKAPVEAVETAGWRGDALEAEAFAWLAVRSLAGQPLSLPETTGVPVPMQGGRHHAPSARAKAASS